MIFFCFFIIITLSAEKEYPIYPVFCLTDYEVQDPLLDSAILDLKNDPVIHGRDCLQKFCATYIQLFRLRTRENPHFLQKTEIKNLQFESDSACQ